MNRTSLPIDAEIPAIIEHLRNHASVIVRAEPGAGKTTRVPPALLDASLAPGDVVVLEPRRVAARAVANRIAYERAGRVGDEVGYQVRNERRGNKDTRLWVVTEGILTRRLASDPFLEGVGVVVLDEFHERSIHADLAIAFLRDVLEVRDDLRVVVMSATLDAGPVSEFLGGVPTVDCPGRAFEVRQQFQPCSDLTDGVRVALRGLLNDRDDDGGDVLVFMPGAREIDHVIQHLRGDFPTLDFFPLFGGLSPQEQDRALTPDGRRRVIVSTNIAETSLTIPRVTAVIDSGLVRQMLASLSTGIDELVTVRISAASAKQRAGRAGRTRPGRVVQLWSADEHHRLEAYEVAEIHRIDLARPVLEVASWGNPRTFKWFEPPPSARVDRAIELLELLGAVDEGQLTRLGRAFLEHPLHPRLAAMVEAGKQRGCAQASAELAAIVAEPDFVTKVHPNSPASRSDLLERRAILSPSASGRMGPARSLGFDVSVPRARVTRDLADLVMRGLPKDTDTSDDTLLKACAAGFPDRVGLRRARGYAFVGGGSAVLGRESLVQGAEAVVAHVVFGTNRDGDGLIRVASEIKTAWLEEVFPGRQRRQRQVYFDGELGRVVARERVMFGELRLSEANATLGPTDDPLVAAALVQEVRRRVATREIAATLLGRMAFLSEHCPELSLPDYANGMEEFWLGVCWGKRSLKDVGDPSPAIERSLSSVQRRALCDDAPERFVVPTGTAIALDYSGPQPVLAVRMQEVFGLADTPRLAQGRVPVLLHLLAPNYRPAQVTSDLRSFWANTYPEVRKEMRARYPKHAWPEDPLSAKAVRK